MEDAVNDLELPATLQFRNESTILQRLRDLIFQHPQLSAMIDKGVPTTTALEQIGLQLFQNGRFSEAACLFQAVIALLPETASSWTNYGTVLDSSGDFAKAAACLEHSLKLVHRQPDTWLLLGLVKKKLGDVNGCKAAYQVSLEQSPRSSVAWQCLGLLNSESKNHEEAISCFSMALDCDPNNAAVAANLGKLCYEIGRMQEASDAYHKAFRLDAANRHYRQMAGKAGFICDVLAGHAVENALDAYECAVESRGNNTREDRLDLLRTAFGQLGGFGHLEAARRVGERYIEMQPGDKVMEYLMRALQGDRDIDRSSPDYIVQHFDEFADGFDNKLVGTLGYDVPEKLRSAIGQFRPAEAKYQVLDIGCGTGLCGPVLRPFAKQLTGIDLSPKMLQRAAARGFYDRLFCEELTTFLARSPSAFDLVVAADVLIYFGDLIPVFRAASAAIRPAGLFAFSTEVCGDGEYRLQPSGRFAHTLQYVRSSAGPSFSEICCRETTIRLEGKRPVPGCVLLFEKTSSD